MEAKPKPDWDIVYERLFNDAISWLGVVGESDHRLSMPDGAYNQSVDKALNFLAGQIAQGALDVAFLLATLEREARLHEPETPDDDFPRVVRSNQMYSLARVMNAYTTPEAISYVELPE